MAAYKTERDAFERVSVASGGSLANANPDYLVALRRHVQGWLDEIDEEISRAVAEKNVEAEGWTR